VTPVIESLASSRHRSRPAAREVRARGEAGPRRPAPSSSPHSS